MLRISAWVWITVGFFVGGSILGYVYFQHYKPDMIETENLNNYAEKLQREADKADQAQLRVDKAVEEVERLARVWNDVVEAKIENVDHFPDLTPDPFQLVVNAPSYRNRVQRAVNRQVKSGGVTVVQGPLVEFPSGEPGVMASYYNFGASRLPFPVVVYELGTVTIRGSMDQIMANVESWSDMPDYFAVADGLAVTGTDNDLTATYNVVILGYLPGPASGPLGAASSFFDVEGMMEDMRQQFDNAGPGSTGGGTAAGGR